LPKYLNEDSGYPFFFAAESWSFLMRKPTGHTTLKLLDGTLQHPGEPRQGDNRLEMLKQALDCLPIQTGITIIELQGRIVYLNSVQAELPEDGRDVETLQRSADTAMYHAKGLGRCNYQFFSREMNSGVMRRVALESSIRQGIARGEFSLHYQPQWDLKNDALTGVEALLRWNSAEFGPVAPGEFIPVAEMSGLILELGEMVLTMACQQVGQWRDTHGELKVAVNISGRQFSHPDFLDTVARIVRESGIDPSSLELEFTESVIMEKADRNVKSLQALKEMGVHLSIDDFGTGYSSLSYLKHFPIDAIKIDRSFIAEVASSSDDAAIAEAIISMAHTLKLQVVAEGVETEAQLQFLRERGCDGAQGFFFAAPMPPAELSKFISGRRAGIPSGPQGR
jgi:EAL domain-containing protein (putative c-di-GMP-specific phosphodiesterase class I)